MRLKDSLREMDTVARFGGDEFVVLLSELSDEQELAARLSLHVGEKIRTNLSTPFLFEGEEVIIGASIGITLFPKGTETVNDLLKEADTAMYQAKASGGNTVSLFETIAEVRSQPTPNPSQEGKSEVNPPLTPPRRGSQKSEVRSQKSEVRSQKSEVRSQKSEVRSQPTPNPSQEGKSEVKPL